MKRSWRMLLMFVAGALSAVTVRSPLAAEPAFPVRPIRLIVPFVAGGGTDLLARLVAPAFGQALGQQLVIDNRGGAGSVIGTQILARSAPDGYTLAVSDTAFVINASLVDKLPYDPENDFTFLAIVATSSLALVTHPGLKVRSIQDLLAAAKKNPGKITVASAGVGSSSHLSAQMLKSAAKVDLLHVPFKGTGDAITSIIGGHTGVTFVQPGTVTQHIQNGTLVPLAITGKKPSPLLPTVPTFASVGLSAVNPETFRFINAPRGLPGTIQKKLTSALGDAMSAPGLQARLLANGFDPEFIAGAEARAFVIRQIATWRQAVMESGARAD
jgi:tripartite-type tricarboxylate transporter receptor subunit TctC